MILYRTADDESYTQSMHPLRTRLSSTADWVLLTGFGLLPRGLFFQLNCAAAYGAAMLIYPLLLSPCILDHSDTLLAYLRSKARRDIFTQHHPTSTCARGRRGAEPQAYQRPWPKRRSPHRMATKSLPQHRSFPRSARLDCTRSSQGYGFACSFQLWTLQSSLLP
jgi:hypothetical protein